MNSEAVQNAINRRGGGGMAAPQLASVAPGTPMATGQLPQGLPPSALDKKSTVPTQSKTTAQKYIPQNQSDMITAALVEQLKSNSQLDKQKLKVAQGQSIQPPAPQAPQMSFNQPPPQNAGNVFGSPASMPTSAMQGGNPLSSGPF